MRQQHRAVLAVILLLVLGFCAFKLGAVVTLSTNTTAVAQTGANGASSSTFNSLADNRAGVFSNFYLPAGGANNISTVPLQNDVYPGFNGKVFVNMMMWFRSDSTFSGCTSSFGGKGGWSAARPAYQGHWCVGYKSASTTQVHKQVDDIEARGFDGIIVTWEGPVLSGNNGTKPEETATGMVRDYMNSKCFGSACVEQYVVMYDGSAIGGSYGFAGTPPAPNGTSITTTADENAVVAKLKDDICYLNANHFGATSYLFQLDSGGHDRPVLQWFVTEAGNKQASAPSWEDTWTQIHNFTQNLATNCPAFNAVYNGAPNNGIPWMEWGTGSGSFTKDGLSNGETGVIQGAYIWENLSGTGVSTQSTNPGVSLTSADSFYKASASYSPSESWGGIWAGFDDKIAEWSPNAGCSAGSDCVGAGRISDRSCGTTWINSIKEIGKFFSTAKPLLQLGVITWNDYDEGTAIEPGIDNCYRVAAALNGSTVTWSLTTVNGVGAAATNSHASLSTVDHMELFFAVDATHWADMVSLTPSLTGSLDLSQLPNVPPGTYDVYVKMVGKNSIVNRTTRAGTYTLNAVGIPAPPPPPPPAPPPGTPPPGTGGTPVVAPVQIPPPPPPPPARKPGQKSVVVIHD